MNITKRTTRAVSGLHLREGGNEGGESRTIEGYALRFGVRSQLLCEWGDVFYEILEPGCVTRDMLDTQDIRLTMFHNRQIILARSKQGKGTLHYEVDGEGVRFWADMPHTADGDKALELVQRGDIDGCSFIYSTDEDDTMNAVSYERTDEKTDSGRSIFIRHVKRIDAVYDFTVTPDPAYAETSITRREVEAAGVAVDPPTAVDADRKAREIDGVRRRLEEAERTLY